MSKTMSFPRVAALTTLICCLAFAPVPAARAAQAAAAAPANVQFWTERCTTPKDKGGKKFCEIFQRLAVQKKGQASMRLLEFAVGFPVNNNNQPRGVLIVPLGVSVEKPMTLQIGDKGGQNSFHIRYCEADGCYAFLDLPDALLAQMKGNDKMTVTLPAVNGKNIAIVMSLKGFGTAMDKIKP
jgi:invasion protein IalB